MNFPYAIAGRNYTGYLTKPAAIAQAPGVLVIHGGGGLGPHAKRRAEMLAEEGYVAFALDLFGEPISGIEHAHVVTHALMEDWETLRLRCRHALDILRSVEGVVADQVAVIGFCFGGQAALEFARSGVDVSAVVGFHSQLATRRPQDSTAIRGKVLIALGDQDRFVSASDRASFMTDMSVANVDAQMLLFSGVNHSFTDPFAEASGLPGLKYDARADRRAWNAMHALFSEAWADMSGFQAKKSCA